MAKKKSNGKKTHSKQEAEKDLRAQKVAVLAGKGLSQAQIAKRLKLSQPSISRSLERARDKEWFWSQPQCTLEPKRIRQLEATIYADGLEKRLKALQPKENSNLLEVKVLDIGESPKDPLEEFGRLAADYLTSSILPQLKSAGIAWGATLWHIVEHLRKTSPDTFEDRPIQFVPICGNPPEADRLVLRSASALVATLDTCINGTYENKYNFTGVVAAFPRLFEGKKMDQTAVDILKRYFKTIEGYHLVFGDDENHDGVILDVEAIFTSVGSRVSDPWLKASARTAGLEAAELAEATFGSIGGWFLPRPECRPRVRTKVDAINKRWTGVRPEELAHCADKARRSKKAGVVVVACGKGTAVIQEAVRRGLVSRLLIDQKLAGELDKATPAA